MAKIANVSATDTFGTWRGRFNVGMNRLNQFAINESSLYANTLTANVRFIALGAVKLPTGTIVNGVLNANGRITVATNLAVTGNTSTNKATVTSSLTVSGNTVLGGSGKTQSSTGVWTQTGNLIVTGNTSANKATVTSQFTVSGNTTLGGSGKTISTTGVLSHTGNFIASANVTFNSNSHVKLPVGLTADRPTGAKGMMRFNNSLSQFEGYNGTTWAPVGGGATGGPGNYAFFENDITVSQSYTISTNKNAMSAGPILVANGVTVTIPTGSVWTVV